MTTKHIIASAERDLYFASIALGPMIHTMLADAAAMRDDCVTRDAQRMAGFFSALACYLAAVRDHARQVDQSLEITLVSDLIKVLGDPEIVASVDE